MRISYIAKSEKPATACAFTADKVVGLRDDKCGGQEKHESYMTNKNPMKPISQELHRIFKNQERKCPTKPSQRFLRR